MFGYPSPILPQKIASDTRNFCDCFYPLKTLWEKLNISIKYIVKQAMNLLFFWESLKFFWLQSSVFALVNSFHHGKFQRFLSLKKPFLDRFAWNICTHFQVICSWTRFERQNLSETLESPLCFGFRKNVSKVSNFLAFLLLKEPLGATFSETSAVNIFLNKVWMFRIY